ncbi:hypothetical protein HB848_11475 [Listeria rocourtiae]|uniref:hypothetical protein n=1 Tax=Listeria rocourtiae TaxID=647910 RepID=UPI0016278FEC|nr:hypothetical protein [Listeria rocourtiae]MBC1435959.1 hypothetical protein [Listeria rocourtiae]
MTEDLYRIRRKQEEEETAFFRDKKALLDQEAALYQHKTETIRALDDLADRTRHYLQDFVADRSDLQRAFQMIGSASDEVTTVYRKENDALTYQLEELEADHRKKQAGYDQELQVARGKEA